MQKDLKCTNVGDLLCSAPYYQNVRKHSTGAGEILCTGKGCVACNPKKNGDESIVRVLGDVDTVNFDVISDNDGMKTMKTRERSETAPGCYGDNIFASRGGNKRKKTAKRIPPSEEKMLPKILVSKSSANDENKSKKKTGRTERSTFLTNKNVVKRNVTFKNVEVKRNNPSNYLAPVPSKPKIIPLKRTKVKEAKNLNKKESDESSEKIKNGERNFGRERHLYHTFPGARGKSTTRGKYSNINSHLPETADSFLEMLKTSEVGIYDPKTMEVKSSIWVEKLLRQGVSEEELSSKIPQAFKERKSGDGSERETLDKITQTPLIAKLRTNSSLPRLSLNGKVEVRGGESVLIIEHEHDKRKEKDGVLHRLGFTLEDQRLKSSRNFPKFSIIEIADSLGEFVQMGAIKVIQRRNKRWLILVEGQTTKDFLLQSGVVLGGRHFELTEIKSF